MVSAANLRDREVINVRDGKRLGIVADVEIDFVQGKITAVIIPGPGKFMGLFGSDRDIIIPWDHIKKIGIDVILVDMDDGEELAERND